MRGGTRGRSRSIRGASTFVALALGASACVAVVVAPPPPPPPPPLVADPIAYWSLDDGSQITVESMHRQHGQVVGATFDSDLPSLDGNDRSLRFDGDDYVSVAERETIQNLDGHGALTLAAWVNPATVTPSAGCGCQMIVSKYNTGSSDPTRTYDNSISYYLLLRGDEVEVFVMDDDLGPDFAHRVSVGADIPIDTWTHVAGTWDGSAFRLYVNGLEVPGTTTIEAGAFPAAMSDSRIPVLIGAAAGFSGGGPSGHFEGLIDEVYIYDRVLDNVEIGSLAGFAIPPAPAGLALYQPPDPLPSGPPGTIIWGRQQPGGPSGATTWLVLYKSEDLDGSDIAVSGQLLVPDGALPGDDRPVLAWAHWTVGNGDECAPSRDPYQDADNIPSVDDFIAAGYVIAATDYQGLGTPGPHAYVIGESEAKSVLDSVRAVQNLTDAAGNRVVVYGGSRGGHAAVSTADHRSYAPEIDLLGVVGSGAGIADADVALDATLQSPGWPFLAMAAWSFETFNGPNNILVEWFMTDLGLANLHAAGVGCNGDVFDHFTALGPASATFKIPRPPATPAQQAALDAQRLGTNPAVPVFLVHGVDDDTVPPSIIAPWAERACSDGLTVKLNWYFDGHMPLFTSKLDVEQWIADRFAGLPAPSDCGAVPPPPGP